jgi:hypothetical protein
MGWIILLVVIIVVLASVAIWLKSPRAATAEFPYTKNAALFSPAERSFLGVLEQAVGEHYRVFGKVRVADVASVRPISDRSAWKRAFNRISAKHFDFVLCTRDDLSVAAAVELDDKSHQQRKRQARDGFLVSLCEAISLPLIQVPARRGYSVGELRAQVLSALGIAQGPLPGIAPEEPMIAEPKTLTAPEHGEAQAADEAQPKVESDAPSCPKCAAPMVRRQARSGANAGQEFWGCSTFPNCRTMIKVSD